jgi:hypothetical protein
LSRAEYRRRRKALLKSCRDDWGEWLKSMLTGRNDPSLRERLRDIIDRAVDAGFPYVIPDDFVDELLRGRNTGAHGGSAGTDYEHQYWLGGGLSWLLRTLLLVELGVPDADRIACLTNNLQLSRTATALDWPRT